MYLRYRETDHAWIVWIASSGVLMRVYRPAVYRRAIVIAVQHNIGPTIPSTGTTAAAVDRSFATAAPGRDGILLLNPAVRAHMRRSEVHVE